MVTIFKILILLGVIQVVCVLVTLFKQRPCPSENEMNIFFKGQLKGKINDRVTRHIGICSICQGKVDDYMKGSFKKKIDPDDYLKS